jgi:hypothetical protein
MYRLECCNCGFTKIVDQIEGHERCRIPLCGCDEMFVTRDDDAPLEVGRPPLPKPVSAP